MPTKLVDLIRLALPSDVTPEEIRAAAPEEMWQKDENAAIAHALAHSPRINWTSYRERNADVKKSGMDPCQHFLKYGLYEGRKLVSWHPLHRHPAPDAPKVSVIINNYNNDIFLPFCLKSVMGQTLREIEIIVVDDCSTDSSMEIISGFAAKDSRIKVIRHETNQGLLLGRKHGVEAATGQNVMFLDSDDYYVPNACEIAYNTISGGYDAVTFAAMLIPHGYMDPQRVTDTMKTYVKGREGFYDHAELMHAIFTSKEIFWQIAVKIITREIAQATFEQIPDAYINYGEDLYVCTVLATMLRNLYKINDRLYVYRYGSGMSTTNDPATILKYVGKMGNTLLELGNFLKKKEVDIHFDIIRTDHCADAIRMWMKYSDETNAREILETIFEQYGFDFVMNTLITYFARQRGEVAEAFIKCLDNDFAALAPGSVIGLYYHRIGYGGVEKILLALCDILIRDGYRIVLFIEQMGELAKELPEAVKIVQIGKASFDAGEAKSHFHDLYRALRQFKVDFFISNANYSPTMLWEMFACYRLHIPFAMWMHGNFSMSMWKNIYGCASSEIDPILSCACVVPCLSKETELYLRLKGVNAQYLPNPVQGADSMGAAPDFQKNIFVVGRFSDRFKKACDAYNVFQDVAMSHPDAVLYMIGDFDNSEERKKFLEKAAKAGLEERVKLTGWVRDPAPYFRKGGILLSTSYIESFGLAIGEALSNGLPCVAYDIPSVLVEDNPAVIRISMGDFLAASREISRLFNNPALWRQMSRQAVQFMRPFGKETFAENVRHLLTTFNISAPWQPSSHKDYANMVKYGSFYAGFAG